MSAKSYAQWLWDRQSVASWPDEPKAAPAASFILAKRTREGAASGQSLHVGRRAAAEMLSWSEKQIAAMLTTGAWTEVDWP